LYSVIQQKEHQQQQDDMDVGSVSHPNNKTAAAIPRGSALVVSMALRSRPVRQKMKVV